MKATKELTQKERVRKMFFKYLVPSIFATLATSVYTLADTIMIGQYEGDAGMLALNIVLPIYALLIGTGVLFGVGGGVMFSVARGRGENDKARAYFTGAVVGAAAVTVALMVLLNVFFSPLMHFMGADERSYPLVQAYARYITYGAPVFVLAIFLQGVVRNDGNPKLAMISVIVGGVLNIIGDYALVFTFDMGMSGAALATVISYGVTSAILCAHFFRKKSELKFSKHFSFRDIAAVAAAGISSFISELANGLIIFVFNLQILKYIGDSGVVVYSVMSNVGIIAMSLFNGAAQGCQPLISAAYGKNEPETIRQTMRLGLIAVAILGAAMFFVGEISPITLVHLFTKAPAELVLQLAPYAIRVYFVAMLAMCFNIFFVVYFQSVVRPKTALALSLTRGVILSGILIFSLPAIFGGSAIWLVIPITETLTLIGALTVFFTTKRPTAALPQIK